MLPHTDNSYTEEILEAHQKTTLNRLKQYTDTIFHDLAELPLLELKEVDGQLAINVQPINKSFPDGSSIHLGRIEVEDFFGSKQVPCFILNTKNPNGNVTQYPPIYLDTRTIKVMGINDENLRRKTLIEVTGRLEMLEWDTPLADKSFTLEPSTYKEAVDKTIEQKRKEAIAKRLSRLMESTKRLLERLPIGITPDPDSSGYRHVEPPLTIPIKGGGRINIAIGNAPRTLPSPTLDAQPYVELRTSNPSGQMEEFPPVGIYYKTNNYVNEAIIFATVPDQDPSKTQEKVAERLALLRPDDIATEEIAVEDFVVWKIITDTYPTFHYNIDFFKSGDITASTLYECSKFKWDVFINNMHTQNDELRTFDRSKLNRITAILMTTASYPSLIQPGDTITQFLEQEIPESEATVHTICETLTQIGLAKHNNADGYMLHPLLLHYWSIFAREEH